MQSAGYMAGGTVMKGEKWPQRLPLQNITPDNATGIGALYSRTIYKSNKKWRSTTKETRTTNAEI